MRASTSAAAFLIFVASVHAKAGDLASLKGPAASVIRQDLERQQRECPSDPDKKCSLESLVLDAKLFYGRFPDRRESVAVLFLSEETGGSGAAMEVFAYEARSGNGFSSTGSTTDAIGEDARNVRFLKGGVIEYTGTVMGENDIHASPSGKKRFELRVDDGRLYFRGPK